MTRLPYAEQAEQAVLGSVIHNNKNWEIIKSNLTVDDFFSPRNKTIFQAYNALSKKKQQINEVTLGEYLRSINEINNIGAHYIVDIIQGCPSIYDINDFVESIKESTGKRSALSSVYDFQRSSKDATYEEIQNLISDLQGKLENAKEYASAPPSFMKIGNIISDYFKTASEAKDFVVTKSGYEELDYLTEGLIYGILDVVAARPGVGKTAFALNLIKQYAIDRGVPTIFFSIEMPKRQIAERLLSIVSGIPAKNIKDMLSTDKGEESDFDKIVKASARLSESPVFYDEDSRRTSDIIRTIKELHKSNGIKFVVIDYLQIIKTERRKNDTRDVEVGAVCRDLQEVAKSLDINILLLCQINRESERTNDKRPKMQHLRESGSIENEAARILLLYRDDIHNTDSKNKGTCEVIVAKNRFGKTGTAILEFIESSTKFNNNPHNKF